MKFPPEKGRVQSEFKNSEIRMSAKLATPHGGVLKPLMLSGDALNEENKLAQNLPQVKLN